MWKNKNGWSEKENTQLRELWESGLTGEKIAAIMGRSKNSVIGRVHRAHLPGRPSPIIRDGRIPQKSHKKGGGGRGNIRPKALPVGQARETVSPELIRRLAELAASLAERTPPPPETRFQLPAAGTCLWPMWQGRVTHEYCGCTAPYGRPYCGDHARVAYTSAPKVNVGGVTV